MSDETKVIIPEAGGLSWYDADRVLAGRCYADVHLRPDGLYEANGRTVSGPIVYYEVGDDERDECETCGIPSLVPPAFVACVTCGEDIDVKGRDDPAVRAFIDTHRCPEENGDLR